MRCPRCGKTNDKVIDSRMAKNDLSIKRRRECLEKACQHRFTTIETIESQELPVRKADGSSQDFSIEKLRGSIIKATEKTQVDAEQIDLMVTEIVEQLRNENVLEILSKDIAEKIMANLKRIDKIAFVRFAIVYKDFREISDLQKEISELE
ncbi:MAG: transcriptional regulator NrdR [Verrucomicrobiota bacterium]